MTEHRQTIPALVLTYDRYCVIADHMIHSYDTKWPGHPFVFHVPFQSKEVKIHFEAKSGPKVRMILSPPGIRPTMDALLDGIDDEAWVYWCMDDRYPITLDIDAMREVSQWILIEDPSVDGVLCTRSPRDWRLCGAYLWRHRFIGPGGRVFLRKKHYGSIWSHQFLRVKVLRSLFAEFPREIKQAKEMDHYLFRAKLPGCFRLYVARESLGLFAESASRGSLTANCVESMRANGIAVPEEFSVVPERIIYNGDRPGAWLRRIKDVGQLLLGR